MKFKIFHQAVMRGDLTGAELRILWYILSNAIGTSGTARISNEHLELALRISHTTVVRAKNSLREKKLLSWRHEGPFSDLACDYSIFLQKEEVRARTSIDDTKGPPLGPSSDLEQTQNRPATQKWLAEHRAKHDKARGLVAQKSDEPAAFTQWKRSAWRHQ